MSKKGVNELGKMVDKETGETVMEMFGPPNAVSDDADLLSQGIYLLSETVIRGLMPEKRGGLLGGDFGYACEYENDVFRLYPDYQDYDEDSQRPAFNFLHKRTGLEICWYKWIGRDMEMNRDSILGTDWKQIWDECYESIPAEAREKSKAEHDYEHTPEYIAEKQAGMERMMEVMMNPEQHGCESRTRTCDSCGKDYSYTSWATVIQGSCDDCMRKCFARMEEL